MNAAELWELALAHHVPYFLVAMLVIWFGPALLDAGKRLGGIRVSSRTRQRNPRQPGDVDPTAQLRAQLQQLNARQVEAARQLAALQGRQEPEHQKEQP